ncbi:MAG: DUF1003 domain-containing protein [Desulfuromonadaceae bacterium]|nr:DUF1003 domain-containing protein [Desulfuromonas sp.]MDY0185992.1 DUF1003 domain-containing protein [Desulfuromonadaceae bacterium]
MPTKPSCQICGSDKRSALNHGIIVRPVVADLIRREVGHWEESGWICTQDLQDFRHKYVQQLLHEEKGEITSLEREVIETLREQELLSKNPDTEHVAGLTFGQHMADLFADRIGSWGFILFFTGMLLLWLLFNTISLFRQPFDPYPYILLNLVLSCIAALQAPIIMMSQGRQEDRDRLHAQRDYQINLKAELEIHYLHQKMDHLLSHQWERLVEIQEIQMELINEVRGKK